MFKSFGKKMNSTNRMIIFLSSSNLFNTILTLISGLFVAKWMLPEDLGIYSSFNIIVSYLILGQLGISNGLSRELPYLIGKNDKNDAIHTTEVAQFWLLTYAILLFVLLSLVSLYYFTKSNIINGVGFLTIAIVSFHAIYVTQYLKILYRTNSDFNKISLIKIVTSVIAFISILLVWKYKFYGLCLRAIIIAIVNFFLFWKWKPISVIPKWDKDKLKDIFKVGFPMFSVANIYGLWPIFQKTLIVLLGGPKFLGLFVLANMVQSSSKQVSASISSVLYPKMSIKWGEDKSIDSLLKIIKKPVLIFFIILMPLFLIAWYLIPYFVINFLVNYTEGIKAAQWTLVLGILSILFVYTTIYNVIKEQKDRLISFIIGILVWLLFIFIQYYLLGFSLEMFPKAMILGQLSILFMTMYNINKYKKLY